MSLSDAFKNYPDLVEAGKAFQDYLNDSGVSADIDILARDNNYPLLQIKSSGSPIHAIQQTLQQKGNCTAAAFAAFNLNSCLRPHQNTLVLTGSAPIVTAIALELTKVANLPTP